jgi:hypothetical protein
MSPRQLVSEPPGHFEFDAISDVGLLLILSNPFFRLRFALETEHGTPDAIGDRDIKAGPPGSRGNCVDCHAPIWRHLP